MSSRRLSVANVHQQIDAMTRIARFLSVMLMLKLCSTVAIAQTTTPPEAPADKRSKIRSAEDGWLDVSEFVDQAYGFLPIVMPITEPAVGFGAVGALAFIDKQNPEAGAGFGRPNISVVGGLATENGTRGLVVGDMRYWLDDRLQTLVGGIKSSVNLDYYGTGEAGFLNKHPRSYALDIEAALLQAKLRIGQSQNWLGLGYVLANTSATFEAPFNLPDASRTVRLGGLLASFSHDSRDNMFTPKDGNYFEISTAIFNPDLGGDLDFKRLTVVGMQYFPLAAKWTLGLRENLMFNYGDAPFYLQPYVMMRGVPAMRYQGEKVAQIEAELRWQFWERFSAMCFVGAGLAADEIRNLTRDSNVVAGGAGLRYEIARKYGIHMGLDVAWSRDGPAVYFQVGSAWMRP
ncbi:MAG TPA: BamA/TamA family outer membrane protein [Azonexus sp.]|nr:BamA/TamA family outer membrane protein [Azonexus sp.]